MKIPIFWKLVIPILTIFVIVSVLISLFSTSILHKAYYAEVQDTLTKEAEFLAEVLSERYNNIPDQPTSDLDSLLTSAANALDLRVTLIALDGVVISDTDSDVSRMDNHLNRPEVATAMDGQIGVEIRYSHTVGADLYYVATGIFTDGTLTAILRVAEPITRVQELAARMNRIIWLGTAAGFGLISLFVLLAVGKITRPLISLTKAAQQISKGEFSDIPEKTSMDEIGELSRAFQNMTSQLSDQMNSLETERKQAQRIFEQMQDGIILVDRKQKIQFINPSAEKILDLEEVMVGDNLIQAVKHYQAVEVFEDTIEKGEMQRVAFDVRKEQVMAHAQILSVLLEPKEAGVVLLLIQDLSRQRNLEKMKEDFVSNVSHELRTPLASLQALNQTLQDGALEDIEASRHFLSRMQTEIDKMTQIVSELLELARIESGRVEMKKETHNLCRLITTATDRMRSQCERASLKLFLTCPDDSAEVLVDQGRIEQVLVNLIHNAIKFTPAGGSITVSATLRDSDVLIEVTDTGVGIPQENIHRIFERFYKTEKSRFDEGTGLGLSISKHIIEAHDGSIWAQSTLGEGASFFFTLPRLNKP